MTTHFFLSYNNEDARKNILSLRFSTDSKNFALFSDVLLKLHFQKLL